MSDTVLALIAGLSAGLAVALGFILLYTRSQRRSASGILATAQAEADRLRGEAVRESESARTASQLAAKMEALKLREDADRDLARRREEFERLERRIEDRGRLLDRKLEEAETRDRGFSRRHASDGSS